MNKIKLKIGNENYENYMPFPFQWQDLLDEQLDEASISLVQVEKEIFKPLTSVEIIIYDNETEKHRLNMLVANDKATEMPSGSGKYNHDINLIEYTKWLEGFMCRSQGYVNSIGRIYADKYWDGENDTKTEQKGLSKSVNAEFTSDNSAIKLKNNVYYSPALSGEGKVRSIAEVFDFSGLGIGVLDIEYDITITKSDGTTKTFSGTDYTQLYDATLLEGQNKIFYRVSVVIDTITVDCSARYEINAYQNLYPLPKWNAWKVCQRALNIAEPLRQGENARFKMDESQRERLESIETPEFQFTQSNLREILQGVGNFIHAEPRLLPCSDGIYQGVITFDKYGSGVFSNFTEEYKDYASSSNALNIENFATNIDSSVGNFVNSLDKSSSLIEPYIGGYKTVLSESAYVRITDENMEILTTYPIRSIKKITVGYIYDQNEKKIKKLSEPIDISTRVVESHEYQQLSSYGQIDYLTSKAYSLYYTIGEKNIKGLNFKIDSLWGAWTQYAIVNILNLYLEDKIDVLNFNKFEYWTLNFQVEYEPIYSARVQQNKSLIENGKEWTKPYNQGQNLVESKFFGENLKGVIARLGNIDKTKTYVINGFPKVLPKVGELYDGNYYISSSAVELQPYNTKITLALSKDFNRYSEFVGVNSTKRMFEISEQQAFESNFTYRNFVVFGDTDLTSEETLIGEYKYLILAGLFGKFSDNPIELQKIAFAKVRGIDKNNGYQNTAIMPVVCSAFGNACVLTVKFEDNYSAGKYSKYWQHGSVTGFNTQILRYTDEWGELKYLKLDFCNNPQIAENEEAEGFLRYPPFGNDNWLNGNAILSTSDKPFLIEKGNTEILSINYQLEFVSAREDIIIGSGLAKKCSLVRDYDANDKVKLYLFKDRLNKFSSSIDITQGKLINAKIIKDGGEEVEFATINPNITNDDIYSSWAIINTTDNSLLIGCNMQIDKTTTNIFKNGKYKGLKMCVKSEKDLYKGE